MPAESGRQRRYMAAARARKRAGHPAKGDPKMSDRQLTDFMHGPADNSTAIGKPSESKAKPVTAADRALSIRHHKDSIQFNERHARDHDKLAKMEGGPGAAYNEDHARAHRAEEVLHRKELASMKGGPDSSEKYKYLGHYATGEQKTIHLPERLLSK